MAEVPKRSGPAALTTSAAAQYTASTNPVLWSILRYISACNEDDTNEVLVTIGINTTLTDSAAKRIWRKVLVPANTTIEAEVFIPVRTNATTPDIVYALADVASRATLILGFVEGP